MWLAAALMEANSRQLFPVIQQINPLNCKISPACLEFPAHFVLTSVVATATQNKQRNKFADSALLLTLFSALSRSWMGRGNPAGGPGC